MKNKILICILLVLGSIVMSYSQNVTQDTCINKVEYNDVKESVNTLLNLYDLEVEKSRVLEEANIGLKLSLNNYNSVVSLQNEKLLNAEKTIGLQQYDIQWLENKNDKLKKSRWYYFGAGCVATIITIILIK